VVDIPGFKKIFKLASQPPKGQSDYLAYLAEVKKACDPLRDAIQRLGEGIAAPYQAELDAFERRIKEIDAKAAENYNDALLDLSRSGIEKSAPARAKAAFAQGQKFYEERHDIAAKAVAAITTTFSSLSPSAQRRFAKPVKDHEKQLQDAEKLKLTDFPGALAGFDQIARTAPNVIADMESDQPVDAVFNLAGVDQKQAYEKALAKAKGDIAACEQDEQKLPRYRQLRFARDEAVKKGNFKNAVGILAEIGELAADKNYGSKIKQMVDAVKVDEATQALWKKQDEAWRKDINISEYTVGKAFLGSGTYGAALLYEKPTTDGGKAEQLVFKSGRGTDGKDALRREAAIYAKIGPHPNIAGCLGMRKPNGDVVDDDDDDDEDNILVLEALTGGSMDKAIKNMADLREKGKLSEQEFWGMLQFSFKKSLEALAYMQQKGVVHRDIKPANIAFDDKTGEPKLIDMGLAGDIDSGDVQGATAGFVPDDKDDKTRDAFAIGASAFEVTDGKNRGMRRERVTEEEELKQYDISPQVVKSDDWVDQMNGVSDLRTQRKKVIVNPDEDDEELMELDVPETVDLRVPQQAPSTEANSYQNASVKQETGRRQKKDGLYSHDSAYVDFIKSLTGDGKRPNPAEALQHPFLQDALLDDDSARQSLIKLLNPTLAAENERKQQEALEQEMADKAIELKLKSVQAKREQARRDRRQKPGGEAPVS
jgi:serine/threonine protein kinase